MNDLVIGLNDVGAELGPGAKEIENEIYFPPEAPSSRVPSSAPVA